MAKKVKDIMTENPVCCTSETPLEEVARMMLENDCGCIPVVTGSNRKPLGTVTDRDITIRAVAQGKNPLQLKAADCMTPSVVTVIEDDSVDDCCQKMEEHKIRRVVVVNSAGSCCGIVAQADIARSTDKKKTGEVVEEVSQPG